MKSFLKILLLCLMPAFSMAQKDPTWGYVTDMQADSLKRSLAIEKNDLIKLAAFRSLGFYYQEFIPDSGLYFHEMQQALAQKLNMKIWQADAYSQAGYVLNALDNLNKSYEYHSEAMKLAGDERNESDVWRPWTFSNAENDHQARIAVLAMNYQMMGNLWGRLREREKQRSSYWEAVKLGELINNGKVIFLGYSNLANILPPDSAIMLIKKGLIFADATRFKRTGSALATLARAYGRKRMPDSAFYYIYKSIAAHQSENHLRLLINGYGYISFLFEMKKNKDSCLHYAKKAYEASQTTGLPLNKLTAYQRLSSAYQLYNKTDSAFKYEKLSNRLNDSLNNARIASLTEYQKFAFNEQQRLKKLDEEKTAYANKLKMTGLIVGLSGILVVALILYRNNRKKQQANKMLEATLNNLKSTQSQLIQSEKMASLGELTAGIAHEIQNPLNFVNNFSEVNKELLTELNEELNKGNIDEAKTITKDAIENEEKIIHHGKRADSIVKGMLQHSRSSTGVKEPTDINALCDEYLRLSYHGLRAKDKTFNAEIKTDFDNTIGKINVVPQEIGRVVLNLINNAFYAVNEKAKQNISGYDPMVTVSTKKLNGKVEISVKDNGNGIPDSIKEKIFQPFFTTKPTGSGTGLGLSLSYDIVKAHVGEIKADSKEGEGTTFLIKLPL